MRRVWTSESVNGWEYFDDFDGGVSCQQNIQGTSSDFDLVLAADVCYDPDTWLQANVNCKRVRIYAYLFAVCVNRLSSRSTK